MGEPGLAIFETLFNVVKGPTWPTCPLPRTCVGGPADRGQGKHPLIERGAMTSAAGTRGALFVLAALLCMACSARPIGLAGQRNSTILIPVGVDSPSNQIGYHAYLTLPVQNNDMQRGQLVFYLIGSDPSTLDQDCVCPGTQPPGPCYDSFANASCTRFELTTRLVTRILPDPASAAGIANVLYYSTPLVGQVLAVADIPNQAALIPGSYKLLVRHRPVLGDPSSETPALVYWTYPLDLREFVVLPGVGEPTPYQGLGGFGTTYDLTQPLRELIPYPELQLLMALDVWPYSGYPAAAEVELSYPDNVVILNVYEAANLGRSSLVRWSDDSGARRVKIHFVNPDQDIYGLNVVFRLSSPPAVDPADFQLISSRVYRLDGSLAPDQETNPMVSIYEIR